jgi:hypothetical protein
MMSASHASRRAVAGREGLAIEDLAHTVLVQARPQRLEVDEDQQFGRTTGPRDRRPHHRHDASAFSWSNVRPSSGLAFPVATAASNAAETGRRPRDRG